MEGLRVVGAIALTVASTVALTVVFSLSVDAAAGLFRAHAELAFAFPLAGIVTWAAYRVLRVPFGWATKHIVGNEGHSEPVSARVVPAIFVGTCLTICVGGSVGKEAAALQMGGGMAATLRRLFKLGPERERLLCACALSCALSVLLGTPVASALFAVEVLQYRSHKVCDYLAIAASSAVARAVSWGMSLDSLAIDGSVPMASPELLGETLALTAACSLLAACFCLALASLRSLSGRRGVQVPVLVAGSVAAAVFVLAFGGDAYSGTGMAQIAPALSGNVVDPFFIGKFLFTLVLLGVGFKGGEIMPTLCIGATFGCFAGSACGVDPAFTAAIALVAYFTACTNCPLAAVALACEAFSLFGFGWYLLASALAYALTFRVGFYANGDFYPELLKDAVAALLSRGGRR
ncbi:MAG: chloride channel protein [Eggerthellaceae bacterium]|nr:chloride channel protein [Eggerthellaceae bacterium]